MKFTLCFVVFVSLYCFAAGQDDSICNGKSFGADSFVCVCDEEHCDFLFDYVLPAPGAFTRYVSNRDEARFSALGGSLETEALGNTTVMIDYSLVFQRMEGFGGAFTDSAGINIVSLPESVQLKALRSYFGDDGIDYRLGRIPIAGSDFSVRPYSYDDVEGDVDLEFFALQEEDIVYKIPLIVTAQELANHQIRLFGSPWAPPAWMKTNGMFNGTGELIYEYRDPYAQYLIKFFEEYARNNISVWGLTPQNEPMSGFEDWHWNTCGFTPEDMRDFIKENLGPAFAEAGLGDVVIMILDYNRDLLPDYPAVTLEDPEASQYVSGIAVHWYSDEWVGPEVLDETHEMFPNAFLLYTEACAGWDAAEDERVILGSWDRAEQYAENIIEDINHHVTGWVDWNLALDLEGGPNWANNFVDAPIIVDAENEVFYKQPTYYALGHFSKFVLPGSDRIYSSVEGQASEVIKVVAFQTQDRVTVVVVLNTDTELQSISIQGREGTFVNIDMSPKSIETILFS